jgi:hypothetical protein
MLGFLELIRRFAGDEIVLQIREIASREMG